MKKRRILLALIMLIICGISLTTATYAWFTANTRVSVDEIDVKATASGGIQISADANSWSNVVTLDQLDEVDTNYLTVTGNNLTPVTTTGVNGGTGKFDFYLGTLDDTGSKVTLEKVSDDKGYYVAFDLYFYGAKDQLVEFGPNTTVYAKNPAGGDVKDAGLKQSMRVGFLVIGHTTSNTPADAIALTGGTEQTIWEPNCDKRTDYAKLQLGAADDTTLAYMGGKAAGTELSMNSEDNFATITASGHNLITSAVGSYPTTYNAVGDKPNTALFSFKAGITKVRTYVWLEGQDIDNEDQATLGTGVGVVLDFKIVGSDAN